MFRARTINSGCILVEREKNSKAFADGTVEYVFETDALF